MKWRAHHTEDGKVDPNVVVSDTHTILMVTSSLFIVFRKARPMAQIIGRWSTVVLARKQCNEDYPGKPFEEDTVLTYPAGRPTLDAPLAASPEPTPGAVSGDATPTGPPV